MAGLNKAQRVFPWGYNVPWQPAAAGPLPPRLDPGEYNRGALKANPKLLADPSEYTPVGEPTGNAWPPASMFGGSRYGFKNANKSAPEAPPPQAYNRGALRSNYDRKTPVPVPWSRDGAKERVETVATRGLLEEKKDLLEVARAFSETSADPAEADWWERRVNSLLQLDAIKAQRALSPEESRIQGEIRKEIEDRAKDVQNLAVHRPPAVAPPAPAAGPPGAPVAAVAPAAARRRRRLAPAGLPAPGLPAAPPVGPAAPPGPLHVTPPPSPLGTPTRPATPPLSPVALPAPTSPMAAAAQGSAKKPLLLTIPPDALGPYSERHAQVTLKRAGIVAALRPLLESKYQGDIKATDPAVLLWHGVRKKFAKHQIAAFTGGPKLADWIVDAFEKGGKPLGILGAYLIQPGSLDSLLANDGALLKKAAGAAEGKKFYRLPNYQLENFVT